MAKSGIARRSCLGADAFGILQRHSLAILVLVAALPRFVALGGAPLDIDETWTWYSVHLVESGRSSWQVLSLGLDGPFFLVSNLAVAALFGAQGPSSLALRLVPALAGTIAVGFVFAVARRLWGPRSALVAGALAALSPFLIFYSRQARPYAFLMLFCVLHVWVSVAARRGRRLAIAATAAFAMASHAFAIVFIGTYHGLAWISHRVSGRRAEQRRELIDAAVACAAAGPFVAFLLWRLLRLSSPYWRRESLDLPAIWAEQFLFLGSSIGGAPESAAWLNRVVTLLLLVPFVVAAWRSPRSLLERPLLWIGIAMPVGVALTGAAIGARALFYPRGFIGATPFLLAGWALLTLQLPIRTRLRAAYAALLLVPFLGSSLAVAINHPAHAYYRDRNLMPEIANRASSLGARYDVLLVHHWWLTQYVAAFHPEPERVKGLGMWRRDEAARDGELVAVLRDLAQVPPDARILLLHNDLAGSYGDTADTVLEVLRSRRELLDSFPCREGPPVAGESMLCDGLFLFGPETAETGTDKEEVR